MSKPDDSNPAGASPAERESVRCDAWISACADLRRHVGNRLREARRRKRVEKHGHMFNSQDFYTGQIAALVELEKMMKAVMPKQAEIAESSNCAQ